MYNFRTDMADERVNMYKASHDLNGEISGIKSYQKEINEHIKQSIVDVQSSDAEKYIGKVIGRYITYDFKDLKYASNEEIEETAKVISSDLKKLVDEKVSNKDDDILVVGLGNEFSTPDSLGPKVVTEVEITRHLKRYAPEYVVEGAKTISAIAPGVLGTTGIESYEIIRAVVDKIKPKLVIAIDSLASKSIKRISSCIQISNTGITPGSGVGNKREELSESTLGVPVISIGVPMVVDLATITDECLNIYIGKLQDKAESNKELNDMKNKCNYDEIKSALIPDNLNLIVTPKEIDDMVENMKSIVAKSINYAL